MSKFLTNSKVMLISLKATESIYCVLLQNWKLVQFQSLRKYTNMNYELTSNSKSQ